MEARGTAERGFPTDLANVGGETVTRALRGRGRGGSTAGFGLPHAPQNRQSATFLVPQAGQNGGTSKISSKGYLIRDGGPRFCHEVEAYVAQGGGSHPQRF